MLWPWQAPDATPTLYSARLTLRPPEPGDFSAWRALRRASREFLKPFEPRWSDADLTRQAFNTRLRCSREEARLGTDYTLFIFVRIAEGERLAGGITLSNIRRRAAQFVTLGYWMGQEHAGKGLMTEAVGTVLPYVFDTLGLHRVHAACLPGNMASRRVLEKNAFREEGYAENYLQIDGRWCDHVLFGLTRERYEAGPRP